MCNCVTSEYIKRNDEVKIVARWYANKYRIKVAVFLKGCGNMDFCEANDYSDEKGILQLIIIPDRQPVMEAVQTGFGRALVRTKKVSRTG